MSSELTQDSAFKAKLFELIAHCIEHNVDGFHFNVKGVTNSGDRYGDWEIIVQRLPVEPSAAPGRRPDPAS